MSSLLYKFKLKSKAKKENQECQNLIDKKYHVVSFDPETNSISSKYVNDVSKTQPPFDYIAIHTQPITQTQAFKRFGKLIVTKTQFLVLDKEKLNELDWDKNNTCILQMELHNEVTLIRTKEYLTYQLRNQKGKKEDSKTYKYKDVDGFYCILRAIQFTDDNNESHCISRIIAGVDFKFQ